MKFTDMALVTEITEGEEVNEDTVSICPNMITGETVHLRKFAAVDRANVQEVLPALPY